MISNVSGVCFEAISACVPKQVIKNREFGVDLYGDKLESLINGTGMVERHVCGPNRITSLDLAVKAAEALMQKTQIDKNDIGAIVFVTLTPDSLMPNNSTAGQFALGLPKHIACLDINHACSGYIYGLWISALLAGNLGKRVLLLDADTNSYYVSPKDKSTAILFGDAGTASLIGPRKGAPDWHFDFFTDGSKRKSIQIPGFGFREGISEESLKYSLFEDGSRRRPIDMEMNGQDVFTYVVNQVSMYLSTFMDDLETTPGEYSHLILHQANAFMLRQLGRKIGFTLQQIPMSMGKFGNTSSASIPLNICSELSDVVSLPETRRFLMSGFGAGLAFGAVDLYLNNVISSGVIEY